MVTEHATRPGHILRSYWREVVAVLLVVVGVEIMNDYRPFDRLAFSMAAFAVLTSALSFFLVFRINEAYSRWWEARTIWGGIVNSSRNLARQVTTLLDVEPRDETADREMASLQKELVYRQIAWVNALRLTLRPEDDDWEVLHPLLSADERAHAAEAASKPTRLLQLQSAGLANAHARGWLSDFDQVKLDQTLTTLFDHQGGCERIKNTAFPDRVAAFTRAIAWLMALFLPVAIIKPDNGWDPIDLIVIPGMMLAFLITERLGAELRNPFDNHINDVPMRSLCRSIEIDLRQQLGEKELPPRIEPVKGVLM